MDEATAHIGAHDAGLNSPRHKGRIRDLECLRGIAVLMVIVYHSRTGLFSWPMPLWDWVDLHYFQTWPGVDLFFAISGFVIARALLPELATSKSPVRTMAAFWIRRFWRLVPSAWFWLGFIVIASAAYNRFRCFGAFHTNFESAIAGVLSIANFREAVVADYGASSPYWSLSLEEQFYFALPILAFLLGRFLRPTLILLTIGVFALPSNSFTMMIRIHAVLLGVLLAIASTHQSYVVLEPRLLKGRPWAGLILLAFIVMLIAALAPIRQKITTHPIDAISVLAAILVFVASYNRDYLVGYRPLSLLLTWVGTRSYALYLVHVPVFCITRETWLRLRPDHLIFDSHDLPRLGLTAGAMLILCAELNYRFLEAPLRRRGAAIAAGLDRHVTRIV